MIVSKCVMSELVSENSFEKIRVHEARCWETFYLVKKKDENKYYSMKYVDLANDSIGMSYQFLLSSLKFERNILVNSRNPFIPRLRFSFRSVKRSLLPAPSNPTTIRKKKITRKRVLEKSKVPSRKIVSNGNNFKYITTSAFLITDLTLGGDLYHWLKLQRSFCESRARFYAAELCSVLEYLHNGGVTYAQIRPENILLDEEGHISVQNFLEAYEHNPKQGSVTRPVRGATADPVAPEYLAPEILVNDILCNKMSDWWSFGILLYEMLYGIPPFYHGSDPFQLYESILHDELVFPATATAGHVISDDAKDLIRKLLNRDPSKRLGSRIGSLEIRQHPFFRGIDWKNVFNRKLTPEFKPEMRNGHDTIHIDPEFLRMRLKPKEEEDKNKEFQGFSYTATVDGVSEETEEEERMGFYCEDLSPKKKNTKKKKKLEVTRKDDFYYDWRKDGRKRRLWWYGGCMYDKEAEMDRLERSMFILEEEAKFIFSKREKKMMKRRLRVTSASYLDIYVLKILMIR